METSGTDRKKLNTVIVDDDIQSRKLLSILLKKFPEVKVVGEASNVPGALNIIEKKNPDSIFLDIRLGNNSGFEVLEKISSQAKIIFVSAYDDYALKAFEVNALDYLTKPINKERLALTISRLLSNDEIHAGSNSSEKQNNSGKRNGNGKVNINGKDDVLSHIIDNEFEDDKHQTDFSDDNNEGYLREHTNNVNKKPLDYDDRLFVSTNGVSKFIKISSIQCITAAKDYSYIYLADGKRLLVLKPMVEWEERLTPKYFVRIHRFTIVNLEYVEKVEKWFNSSYHVYIKNINEPFQMSRRYASKLKASYR